MTTRFARLILALLLGLQLMNPAWPACGGERIATVEKVSPASGGERADSGERAVEKLRPALAASAFLLGTVAAIFEVESDRAYARYLGTADPSRMSSYYDTAERKGDLSTAALIGAELCAVTLMVTYLIEKRPEEPEPGAVIIGFAVTPGAAAIQIRW